MGFFGIAPGFVYQLVAVEPAGVVELVIVDFDVFAQCLGEEAIATAQAMAQTNLQNTDINRNESGAGRKAKE